VAESLHLRLFALKYGPCNETAHSDTTPATSTTITAAPSGTNTTPPALVPPPPPASLSSSRFVLLTHETSVSGIISPTSSSNSSLTEAQYEAWRVVSESMTTIEQAKREFLLEILRLAPYWRYEQFIE
jgi:hypothetical protein